MVDETDRDRDPTCASDTVRTTRGVLATGHRDHDTANQGPGNLADFRQPCHLNHDRPEHRRWSTLFESRPLDNLFHGPYHKSRNQMSLIRVSSGASRVSWHVENDKGSLHFFQTNRNDPVTWFVL